MPKPNTSFAHRFIYGRPTHKRIEIKVRRRKVCRRVRLSTDSSRVAAK